MKKLICQAALSLLLVCVTGVSSAADVWWHQVPANAAQDNGNVTLLDANGNPINMVVNPTAAAVQANKAAATQPPTVIVQATTGYWKDPVTNVADLPGTGNSAGDVRMVTSTAKPYMWTGSGWVEQSSDYSGTVKVGNVLIQNVATEGTSCTPNGLMAVTSTGLTLSCASGVWMRFVRTTGDTMTGRLQTMHNDWSLVALDPNSNANSAKQSAVGSIYINDAYIRSVGLWLSQINFSGYTGPQGPAGPAGPAGPQGPPGQWGGNTGPHGPVIDFQTYCAGNPLMASVTYSDGTTTSFMISSNACSPGGGG